MSNGRYSWNSIYSIVKEHKKTLVLANVIAIMAAAISVPVPLLMPLLVDEVLLDKPGKIVGLLSSAIPEQWLTPVNIIIIVMLLSMLLRLVALLLAVWQTREFTRVAKDVTYRIRLVLLQHLQRVSMAEYEAAGSGAITSHLVTDVTAIDDFLGATLSKFIVAVLTVIGVAIVLLVMHWQLALFILLMTPVSDCEFYVDQITLYFAGPVNSANVPGTLIAASRRSCCIASTRPCCPAFSNTFSRSSGSVDTL